MFRATALASILASVAANDNGLAATYALAKMPRITPCHALRSTCRFAMGRVAGLSYYAPRKSAQPAIASPALGRAAHRAAGALGISTATT
jgi:hypothetical protein